MKHFIILSILCISTAVALGQDNSQYLQNGNEAFAAGDYDRAIKQYKAYKAIGGTENVDKRIADSEKCKENLTRADRFFDEKDYVQAAKNYFDLHNINLYDRHASNRLFEIKKTAGIEYDSDGYYTGEYDSDGMRHGQGVYYKNEKGEQIHCEWVRGIKEGQAIIKYARGKDKKGTFKNDIFFENPKKFHFGLALGGSLSNIETDSWLFDDGKNPRLAFDCLDLLMEYRPVRWLSFQPELQVKFKGARGKGYTSDRYTQTGNYIPDVLVKNELNLTYLQLPLNLLFNIPVSDNASIFFGGGYYFAYGVYGELHLTPEKDRYSFEKETEKVFSGDSKILNPLDQGINTMFGVRFKYSDADMFIRAGYEWSLDNMAANKGAGMATFKNNCISLQFGGYF